MWAGRRGGAHRRGAGSRVLPGHRGTARPPPGAPAPTPCTPATASCPSAPTSPRPARRAGLVFIGPPPAAIRAMGDKAPAKRRMLAAGVPCAPGLPGRGPERRAPGGRGAGTGPAAAGQGRGRRWRPRHAAGARPPSCRRRWPARGAKRKRLRRRHADAGAADRRRPPHRDPGVRRRPRRAVHLGERDCTAQRRRQKVDRGSALAPGRPGDARRDGPRRGGRGAGGGLPSAPARWSSSSTPHGRHYFLEMNTRLQVEHPVTECITGLDLVEWQLRVAAGEPLPLQQDEVRFKATPSSCGCTPKTPTTAGSRRPGASSAGPLNAAGVRIDHGIAAAARSRPTTTPWWPSSSPMVATATTPSAACARAGRVAADRPDQQRPLPARPAAAPAVPRSAHDHHAAGRVGRRRRAAAAAPGAARRGLALAAALLAGRPAVGRPASRNSS
jgi:hypothetical protein